jgi:hypothetical protein
MINKIDQMKQYISAQNGTSYNLNILKLKQRKPAWNLICTTYPPFESIGYSYLFDLILALNNRIQIPSTLKLRQVKKK